MYNFDTVDTELRVLALHVKIDHFNRNYETFSDRMDDLCALCIEFSEQHTVITKEQNSLLFTTTTMLLKHYPEDEKMQWSNFELIMNVCPKLSVLGKRYRKKFEGKPMMVLR